MLPFPRIRPPIRGSSSSSSSSSSVATPCAAARVPLDCARRPSGPRARDGRRTPPARACRGDARAGDAAGGGRRSRRRPRTNAEGEFQFDRVLPGRYEVRVDGGRLPRPSRSSSWRRPARSRASRVALHVSAVTESVVVSAAQVEMPLARAADSVTVVSSRDLQAAQVGDGRRCAARRCRASRSRATADAARDVAVPARRRVGLHAGPGRRHQGERLRRRLRLLDAAGERRGADRGRARTAERALRRRRDRRRSCRSSRGTAGRRASKGWSRAGASARRAWRPGRGAAARAWSLGRVRRTHGQRRLHRRSRPPPASRCRTTTSWSTTRVVHRRLARRGGADVRGDACATRRAIAATRARSARTRSAPTRRSTGSRAA